MKKQNWLSFLSEIQIPPIIYVGLLFGVLIILFFAFRFFSDNFVILSIIAIFISAIALFGFFFLKVFKGGSERKAYSVLTLLMIPLLLNSPYADSAVIPLDELNSGRVDSQEFEKLRIELKEEIGVIKADIALIKTSISNPPEPQSSEDPDFILIAFPIIIVQLITTAILILFFRNK